MPNIIDILARALSLRQETALNSITPNRAGGIMYDTLLVLNQMQLEGGSLLISKVYASVSAMEADTTPTSDLTGRALKPGQLVVIVTSDSSSSDMGSEYRYNGPGSWTYVGKVGGLPLDTVPTQSSTKGITSGGVYAALAAMKAEGYKYMGLATPGSGGTAPGTPNQPVFYIAGPGSYPNFGSITVASGYLGFIKYSGGSWSVESVAVGKDYDAQISALDGQITQLEAKVGKITLPVTESGYYITCNAGVGNAVGAKTSAPTYCYIKQAVAEGDKIVLTGAGASAGRLWCFANANDIILSVANKNTSATNLELTAPANSAYIIINSTIAGLGVCTLLPASSLEATEKRDVGILTKSVETVAGRPVEIVKNTYTFSTDGTNNIFTFDFGETLIKSGQVDVVGDAITLVDYVKIYDEFDNIILATGYFASVSSVAVPAGTRKVSLFLRPATYPDGSPLALKMTGVLGNILGESVLYPHIYLEESGGDVVNVYAQSDQYIVGRFPVKPGTRYAFIGGNGLNPAGDKYAYVVFFDAEGNQLSWYKPADVRGTNAKPTKSAKSGFYFQTPAGCSWIFISVQNVPSDNVVAELIPYAELTTPKERTPLNIWVLGDSISATGYLAGNTPWKIDGDSGLTYGGIGGWISRFMEKVSLRPLKWANYSAGGYTLTDTTQDFSANSYINRLEQAIADYGNDEVSAPDILMVVGCTNDVEALPARNVTEEEISASSFIDYDNYCEYSFFVQQGGTYYANPLIQIADVNKGKIIGAMRYIVERVGTLFPNCKFVFVTPPQSSRKGIIKQMACNKDMKWGAARLCVPIIDVWSNAQMPLLWDYNADWSADNLDHRFLCDGIHTFYDPTTQDPVLGWERQGEYIANEFSRIFKFDLEA